MGTIDNTLEERRTHRGTLDNDSPARIITFRTKGDLSAQRYADAAMREAKHLRNIGWTEEDMKYAALLDNLAEAIWTITPYRHRDCHDWNYWQI